MGKNNCSKQDSKPDGKGQPNDQNQPKVNCILHFKDPKPSNNFIKAKFYEADETEVSKLILLHLHSWIKLWVWVTCMRCYKMENQETWSDNVLSTRGSSERQLVRNNCRSWLVRWIQTKFQSFGPTAYKDQCKAMQKGKIKITENNLQKGTEWLFQINKLIIYLGIYTRKYSVEELNKIIEKWQFRIQARYFRTDYANQ